VATLSRQLDPYDRIKVSSAHFAESPVRRNEVGIDAVSHLDFLSFFARGTDVKNRRIFKVRRVEVLCHSRCLSSKE
jgi:hypothetical protein